MNARIIRAMAVATLAGTMLVSAGCVRVELPKPEYKTTHESIDVQDAKEIHAELEMGAGRLNVEAGEPGSTEAQFGYTDPGWKPIVSYDVREGAGDLAIRTPENLHVGFGREMHYDWRVELPMLVPIDLSVAMGAGESTLDLVGIDLTNLQVDLGAGESTIDLSGDWSHDLSASINAGVGALRLKVPENVGVRIVGYQDGVGEYRADGFKQDGNALVNDAYGTADVTLDITLQRGIGEVVVETVR